MGVGGHLGPGPKAIGQEGTALCGFCFCHHSTVSPMTSALRLPSCRTVSKSMEAQGGRRHWERFQGSQRPENQVLEELRSTGLPNPTRISN